VDKKYELEGSLAVVQQKLKSTEGDIKNMQDEIHGMGEDLQVRRRERKKDRGGGLEKEWKEEGGCEGRIYTHHAERADGCVCVWFVWLWCRWSRASWCSRSTGHDS
jgi:hypothetical protein